MNVALNAPQRRPTQRQVLPVFEVWLRWAMGAAGLAAALTFSHPALAAPAAQALQQPVALILLAAALVLVGVALVRVLQAIRDTRQPPAPRTLDAMDWSRLASLANRFFTAHGLVRDDAHQAWAEAADLVLHRGSRRYLLHAGLWQAPRIDAAAVQKLAGQVARQRAQGGFLLCAQDAFTAAAHQLAREHGILLLHPARLKALPKAAKPRPGAAAPHPLAPTLVAPEPPAAARKPVLRPDDELGRPRTFMPTVPMSPQVPVKTPVLRPDHEFRAPRPFLPTVPMMDIESDLPEPLDTRT